jgi:hypothetical protein
MRSEVQEGGWKVRDLLVNGEISVSQGRHTVEVGWASDVTYMVAHCLVAGSSI